MRKNEKMNTKNILVSFLLIASVLFLATAVSAGEITTDEVRVDGIWAGVAGSAAYNVSVIAGDTITVKVVFTADEDATDVRVRATIEGNDDVTAVTSKFDVEYDEDASVGRTYVKTLTLKVPSDLDAEDLSDELNLNIEISSHDDAVTANEDYTLNVQRDSYDLAIKSINADNTINAGKTMPVEVVLKNVGYNNADDVYITVSIPELNIVKSTYLGDLVTENYLDEDDDNDGTVTLSAKLNLDVPYSAKAGIYTLVVEAKNDETKSTDKQEITITNSVSDVAMKSGNNLILLNPTSNFVVYKVVYNDNEQVVVVPAASSQTVPIETSTDADVLVYNASDETLVSTVKFSGSNQSVAQLTSPVFILTVVLAIVFLVLLVVLVVLITKKPQKAEEFGESYY